MVGWPENISNILPRKFIQLQSTPFRISLFHRLKFFNPLFILYRFFPLITTTNPLPHHRRADDGDLGDRWMGFPVATAPAAAAAHRPPPGNLFVEE